MPILTDVVDAIVEINSHRDTYEVQLATPAGTPIATVSVRKDTAGYSDLLTWLVTHAPGHRLTLSSAGADRYTAGLARAVTAAGLIVIEPPGKDQAALSAACRAAPGAWLDADRDALRILLGARQDLTSTTTRQSTLLRGLLLSGDATDRKIARAAFTEAILINLARRPEPHNACRQRSVRHAEIRRLAHALITVGRALRANSTQLQAIVDELVPGLTDQRGIGPINAAQAIVSLSCPSTVPKPRQPPATGATSSPQWLLPNGRNRRELDETHI